MAGILESLIYGVTNKALELTDNPDKYLSQYTDQQLRDLYYNGNSNARGLAEKEARKRKIKL